MREAEPCDATDGGERCDLGRVQTEPKHTCGSTSRETLLIIELHVIVEEDKGYEGHVYGYR